MKKKRIPQAAKPRVRAGGSSEPLESRRGRARAILEELRRLYPEADCALEHKTPLQLLVSTILSAQCTDDRVNMVTPQLFARYPDAPALAAANPADVEGIIKSTGFFRNKTKNIIGAGKVITEKFSGKVPDTMEHLLEVPGVARKTANVVLGTWFKRNEGVVVDTHIGRLSHRLGLSWRSRNDKDAVRIEQDLMEVFPREEWTFVGHALIWHGRKVCSARKPACDRCSLAAHCPSAFSFGNGNALADSKARTPKRTARRRPPRP